MSAAPPRPGADNGYGQAHKPTPRLGLNAAARRTSAADDWPGDPQPLPEAVQLKFDALPPDVQELFTTVHADIPNKLGYCKGRVLKLRVEHGWSKDEVITLAEKGGFQFGTLGTATWSAFEGIWKDRDEYEAQAARERAAAEEWRHSIFDPWAELEPPEWPAGVLRPDFEATLKQLAERDGCDLGALCMAYLTAVSGAAFKDTRFVPFQHGEWQVPPIIYVMVVSDPGLRKTVLNNTAFAALWRHDNQEWDAWQQAAAAAASDQEKPEEPAPLIVDNVTTEKLQAILARSPRGACYLRDEIAPMFDFRRYAKGTGAEDRSFFLSNYEGNERRAHRVGRATDHGKPTGVAIFGGIQIDRIAEFKDLGDDGLMQRFVPIIIARHKLSEPDVQVRDKHKLDTAVRLVLSERYQNVYCTTPEGSALIRATEELGHKMGGATDYGKIVQGFCYKLHGLHARLAFLLHLLDAPQEATIPAETIERASRLMRFCLRHFLAFSSRTTDQVLEATRAAASYIIGRPAPVGDETERILASMLTGRVRLCRGMSPARLQEVLAPLIAGGWLTPESPYSDNHAWIVTPRLRDRLSDRHEAERERRKAAREAILAAVAER